MQDIIAGIRTFQRDVYPQYRELFEKLAAGQSPKRWSSPAATRGSIRFY
jgi:hypothetical protein